MGLPQTRVGQHSPTSLAAKHPAGGADAVGQTRKQHTNTARLQVQFRQGSVVGTRSPWSYRSPLYAQPVKISFREVKLLFKKCGEKRVYNSIQAEGNQIT